MQQENRRGWRTGVYVVSNAVYLAFVGWIIHLADMSVLKIVAIGLLINLTIAMVSYGLENGIERFRIHVGETGADIEAGNMGNGNPQ